MTTYYPPIGSSGNRMKPNYGYGPFSTYGHVPAVHPQYLQAYHHQQQTLTNNPSRSYSRCSERDYSRVGCGVAPAISAPTEVSGGITAVMEYEPQTMASFLSWCAFGMLKQGRNPSVEFELAIVSILNATRLPKSTIIIALEYINQRFCNRDVVLLNDNELFNNIVIALVLANKFNDDNTFTNRSWCGATGLQIEVVNKEEAAWLKAVNWNLSVVGLRSNIECLEECWSTWLTRYSNTSMYPALAVPTYTAAYSPTYTASFSPYTPLSPLHESRLGQGSLSSSPVVCDSPVKYNYEWQNSQHDWGFGYTGLYLQPPIRAHIPVSASSNFGGEFYAYGPNYYNCMASC